MMLNQILNQALLGLVCLSLVCGSGCDRHKEDLTPEVKNKAETQQCAGASKEDILNILNQEGHPRVFKGRVLWPEQKTPKGAFLPAFTLSYKEAWAYPLDGEKPVANAVVTLFKTDPKGKKQGKVLLKTLTNNKGEYCLRLSQGWDLRPSLMLEAKKGDMVLRHLAVHHLDANIYAQTEALIRILEAHQIDFQKLSPQGYLNLRTTGETAAGLMRKKPLKVAETGPKTLKKVQDALLEDERFNLILNQVKKAAVYSGR